MFTSDGLGIGLVSGGIDLVILVLILRIWSCLHHWCGVSAAVRDGPFLF